jgi:N-methylhydantoinase A
MGERNVIVGDMGGTSFDTSLVEDLSPSITPRIEIDQFDTGISLVDVISIGAGGGSIAWIDNRGVPQVGPRSAGSSPGPACYGRGGTAPTVTDAAVVLGLIDLDGYLGGRMRLDREAAEDAIVRVFRTPFGWSALQAAEGIVELTCTNMAHALRRVSVERGHDPRAFLMLAYGGTLPLFVTRICAKLGMTRVVVPYNSSVFSAFGVLVADYVRRYSRTVEWDLSDPSRYAVINERRDEMLQRGLAEAAADGFAEKDCLAEWGGEFRFQGQVYEVSMPLPNRPLTGSDAAALALEFPRFYERVYGPGTAWVESRVFLLTLSLTVRGTRRKPSLLPTPETSTDARAAQVGTRLVFLGGESGQQEIPVYEETRFLPGMRVRGPAIVDEHDTTVVVPKGWTVARDPLLNFVLTAQR